jgi:hypothetical protein
MAIGRDFAMLDVDVQAVSDLASSIAGVVRGCIALRERAGVHGPRLDRDPHASVSKAISSACGSRDRSRPFRRTFMSATVLPRRSPGRVVRRDAGRPHRFRRAGRERRSSRRVTIVSDASRARGYAPRIEAHLAGGPMLEWEEVEGADAYRLNWNAAVRMTALLTREAGAASDAAQHLVGPRCRRSDATPLTDLIDAMRDACASAPRSSP